uniref:Uncharacterized protein n=1 Tax=Anguilla anguilla TaxID=7936 RepID=A0A0E9VNA9_ANGAN
MEEASTLWL